MSTRLRHFRVIRRPAHITSTFTLLVVDGNGQPHLPLTIFYHQLNQQLANGTARTYLNYLLPWFDYLSTDAWRLRRSDHWNSPPENIQEAVRDYLINHLHCKVQPKSSYVFITLTKHSPSTVHVFLSALKQFYTLMIREKHYMYAHPLLDAVSRLLRQLEREDQGDIHRMPQLSGVEEAIKSPLSENFFRIAKEQWEVTPVDDPELGKHLLEGCMVANFCLRDQIVVRLALETGARIREILTMTVGDWRTRGCNQEASSWSKGSRGRRVKTLRFSSTTAKMLRQYINTDRAALDQELRRLDQLSNSDPLFLSQRKRPYDYEAFKVHWYKLCRRLNLDLNIHALRHWYTTQSMRLIVEEAKTSAEVVSRKEELVRYMAWHNPDTLKTYENYFKRLGHYHVQDQLHQTLEEGVKTYLTRKVDDTQSQRQHNQTKTRQKTTTAHGTYTVAKEMKDASGWEKLLALGGTQ